MEKYHPEITPEAIEPGWNQLYKIAGWSGVIMILLIPVQIIIFFIWPPPVTVSGWFELFRQHPLIGLIDMDILLSLDYILLSLVFLALYVALKRINHSLMTVALTFQLIGIATYFSSATAFEMLSLSNEYAAATSDGDKQNFMAAGHGMLVTWQGTAFDISYLLGGLALSIVSAVMSKSKLFNKLTSTLGLVMGILMLVPPTVEKVGIIISLLSLIPLIPWLFLIVRKFFQLAHTN